MATRTPWDFAKEVGIVLAADASGLFRVGTCGDVVLFAWDASQAVCDSRAWEGIARCLLERSGVDWTVESARAMARQLRSRSGEWESGPINPRIRSVH